jgi:hypothetical protein
MASFILSTLKSQLPALIEKSEPQIEAGLVSALQGMREKHPEEARLFLANWAKLDRAVRTALQEGGRRKRTRRTRRRRTFNDV